MAIIKLVAGAAPVRFVAERIEDTKSARGLPQWKFVGRTPTDGSALIFITASTAERQCARHGWDRRSIIGKAIQFSKTAPLNYIDIDPQPDQAVQPSAPPQRAAAVAPATPNPATTCAPERKERCRKDLALYAWCLDHVITKMTAPLTAAGITVTHEGIARATQTLFDHFAASESYSGRDRG